jgi:hypothetical protein
MEIKKQFITISGVLLVLSLMVSSCSASKKAAITCPEFSYNKIHKTSIWHLRNKRGFPVQGRIIGKKQHTGSSRKIQNKNRVVSNNSSFHIKSFSG